MGYRFLFGSTLFSDAILTGLCVLSFAGNRGLDCRDHALTFEIAVHLNDAEIFSNFLDGLFTVEIGNAARNPFVENVVRSEEHTSELQSLMRISYAGFCLKKKIKNRMLIRYI